MNTPYNKDLIIDDGLGATIRNAFVIPLRVKVRTYFWDTRLQRHEEKYDTEMTNMSKKVVLSDNDATESCKNVKSEIFIIFNPKCTFEPSENTNAILRNVSKDVASSSNNVCNPIELPNQVQLDRKSLSESDLEDNEISFEDTRLCNGKAILWHMLENINNEDVYLHYFLQLINYEDTILNKDNENFEIMHLVPSKPTKLKTCKHNDNLDLDGNNLKKSHPSSSVLPRILTLKNYLSGNVSDRIQMRKLILDNFNLSCKDQESYNRYLTELIDFEEELTE
jgi:hypothetical protein